MTIKIGFVGAPGSGKTTLAASLYAELLKRGVSTARLVPEAAQEHIGSGKEINIQTQQEITLEQINRELKAESCGFDVLVCDSAAWLGSLYMRYNLATNNIPPTKALDYYMDEGDGLYHTYDYMIYVPLFVESSQISKHRIHDYSQSEHIDALINQYLHTKANADTIIERAPRDLGGRNLFIYDLATEISKKHSKSTSNIKDLQTTKIK